MCYERLARRRDEAVESQWLRELNARDRDDPRPRQVGEPAVQDPRVETPTNEVLEPVGVD